MPEADTPEFDDICRYRVDSAFDEVSGVLLPPGGRTCASGRPCVVPRDQAGTLEQLFDGVCLTPEYCQGLAAAPELGSAVRCLDANGEPWDGRAPDDPCPLEAIEGQFCGPVTGGTLCVHERALGAYSSCIGPGPNRGVGVCAPTDQRCVTGDADLSSQALQVCEVVTRGAACVCMRLLGEPFSEAFPTTVRSATCEAYARLYPASVECLTMDEVGDAVP